jgi:hypothetical protein
MNKKTIIFLALALLAGGYFYMTRCSSPKDSALSALTESDITSPSSSQSETSESPSPQSASVSKSDKKKQEAQSASTNNTQEISAAYASAIDSLKRYKGSYKERKPSKLFIKAWNPNLFKNSADFISSLDSLAISNSGATLPQDGVVICFRCFQNSQLMLDKNK